MLRRSLVLSALTLAGVLPATASAAPTLEVRAPEVVRVGQAIPLQLGVAGGTVRAFQASATFDHARAERNGLRFNAGRRGVQSLGPVTTGATESFGAVALGRRAAGLGTLELLAAKPGPLRVRLHGVEVVRGDGRTVRARPLTLILRVRPASAAVPSASQARTLRSAAAVRHRAVRGLDATGDDVVDRADAAELAFAWTQARRDGAVCSRLGAARDVTGDRCLDVSDVQRVATRARGRLSAKPLRARVSVAAPFVVNSTADQPDAAADGLCRTSKKTCTLRAAITESNRQAGANSIAFDIGGGGLQTIQLASVLPTISDTSGPVTIDGYTQPGAAPNTDPQRSTAKVLIQVRGTGYGSSGVDAFNVSSANNVIRGLATFNIRRSFEFYGTGATGNVLTGNFIGTNAAGTAGATSFNSAGPGVQIEAGAARARIGGPAPADRNVVSGNARHGIALYGIGTSATRIQGNIVGLSPLGDRRVPNMKHGLDVNEGASDTLIGGTGPGERNVISGNGFENLDDFTAGIEVSHMAETTGTRIVGNLIGTDVTGDAAPDFAHNSHYGIRMEDRVRQVTIADNVIVNSRRGAIKADAPGTTDITITRNRIGLTASGAPAGNGVFGVLIAFRATDVQVGPDNVITGSPVGVQVGHPDSDANTITRNSIYGNAGLGIDLEPWNAVSYNDAGDADTGTNQGLNFPAIAKASATAASGTACAGCTVEVFRADTGSGAGVHGEGKDFLGSAVADGTGNWTVALSGVADGEWLTSTATDPEGNTSEFSEDFIVGDTAAPVTTITCEGGACQPSYPGAVQVALAATDAGGSGLDSIRYTTDGSAVTASSPKYTAPFAVGTTTTVRFRAFDRAGNAEVARAQEIRIGAPEPTPVPFVRDEFERSVTGGLGTADLGGAWAVNAPARTSVAGGEAVLSGWTAANQDTNAATSPARADMEVLARVRLSGSDPVGGAYQARVVARAQADARNGYAARVSHAPSGQLNWGLSRIDNAGGTGSLALGSGTLTASGAAGTSWWIRLRTEGTSVKARFWQDGTPEPTTWRASVTDGYFSNGRAALGALMGGAATAPFPSIAFPSFTALDLAG